MRSLTWSDSVEHGERVVGSQGCDVQVLHGDLLSGQRRQLVEVRGEQAEAADFGGDVLADGPGQTEPVVGRRASAELVDDDERVLRGRAAGTSTDEGETRVHVSLAFGPTSLCASSVPTAGWRRSPASRP